MKSNCHLLDAIVWPLCSINKATVWTKLGVFILGLVFYTSILGQNQEVYFKTLPPIDNETPDWAVQMYANDPVVYNVIDAYTAYYKKNKFKKTVHTQNYKYWIRQVEKHINEKGQIRPQKESKSQIVATQKNAGPDWEAIGPFETYREGIKASWQAYVSSMDVCEANPNIGYASSFSLYKTTDKGNTWFPITYDIAVNGIERVAVAPNDPNLVYFATPSGIWKSTNGNDFTQILTQSASYHRILIHPNNSNIVFLGSSEGMQRSTDGGASWTNIKSEECWDIDFHPSNPTTVYATFNNPTAIKSEFWKSTNTGVNFNKQSAGWYNSTDPNRTDGGSRIAVTAANPNRVYVGLVGYSKAGDNNWIGVYRSDDAGVSWFNPSGQDGGPYAGVGANSPWNIAAYGGDQGVQQGFYNFDIGASNSNADKIWVGTIRLSESSNGGQTFQSIGGNESSRHTNIHADIQEIVVVGNDIWVASDGGVDYSNNELQTHASKKYGINGANYWGFDAGKSIDVMVGGTYHNGNNARHPNYTQQAFQYLAGAESPTGYVDGADNNKIHCSDIWSSIISTTETVPRTWLYSFLDLYPNESYGKSQSSEIVYDVNTPTTCYLGKEGRFYKSTNSGQNFTSLFTFNSNQGSVFEIEQSQQNANKFYLVFYNTTNDNSERGQIYKTNNGGTSWTKVTDIPAANHPYLEISINPNNDEELWVANTQGGSGEKVYRTTNGGSSWTNETQAEIANVNLHDILFIEASNTNNKDRVYIASENAMHFKNVTDANWQNISGGLPLAYAPNQMAFFPSSQLLRVATRGHGIWQLDVSQPCDLQASIEEFTLCANDRKYVGVEVDGVADYQLSWSDDGNASTCNQTLTQMANLYTTDANQLITDFCGNTAGEFVVDLKVFTNCYNTNSSFKGKINLSTNTIEVLEYIHFNQVTPTAMSGNGTATVTSSSTAYAAYQLILNNNKLYLNHTNAPCGSVGYIRLESGSIGTNSGCAKTIPEGSNLTLDGGDQFITDFCSIAGMYYVDLEFITNCYNTEASLKAIVNTEANTIDVLEYIHFNEAYASSMSGDGTNSVISTSAAYAQIEVWVSGTSLYLDVENMPCGSNAIVRILNGNIHPAKEITSSGTYHVDILNTASCMETKEITVNANNLTYTIEDFSNCANTGYVGIEVDGVDNYFVDWSNSPIERLCQNTLEEGANLSTTDANQLITDFCGNTTGEYYIALEVFTSCYSKISSFEGKVNLNNNTIEVLEYLHFNDTSPSTMSGNGTATLTSSSAAFAEYQVILNGNKLYLKHSVQPCGSGYIKITQGNLRPYDCMQILPEGDNLRLNDGDQLITDFCSIDGSYYIDLEFLTNCYNTEASLKAIVNTETNTINVLEYIHFNETSPSTMSGDGTNSVISTSAAYAQIEVWISGTSLYLDAEDMPCGANSIVRVLNGNIHPAKGVNSTGIYSVSIISESGCRYTEEVETMNLSGPCDDGDECTTGDTYNAACNCIGTFADSDNDGVCDANDSCPNEDDSLIGTACDDGNDCTTGDIYDESCNCLGAFADADYDGVCDANDSCPNEDDSLIGTACDDGNDCTTGDIYDESCNCLGAFADADYDGVCDANDVCPNGDDTVDTNGNGIPDECDSDTCTYIILDEEDFEESWGIWRDGGSHARRNVEDANYASSGQYCIRLRKRGEQATTESISLDLSSFEEVSIDFSYFPRSMDNSNEDFWLQLSNDGGDSFTTIQKWSQGNEFENGRLYHESVNIVQSFSANTQFRFRCDANGKIDFVYIDDIKISACTTDPNIDPSTVFDAPDGNRLEGITDFIGNSDIQNIRVFPNPVAKLLYVFIPDEILDELENDLTVNVYTINGKTVLSKTFEIDHTIAIDVNALTSNQMYIVELSTAYRNLYINKFIKQ